MSEELTIPQEVIASKIYQIRNKKVMLSSDLAELYQVETRRLNEQVKRNINRFPKQYMFRLTIDEHKALRSQNATLKRGQHSKYPPYAFTEHGVLMLSSVLRSERAEKVNLLIIDTFVELNKMLLTHKDILLELEVIRKKVISQDKKIELVMEYLNQFIQEQNSLPPIGFKQKGRK
ncbi:MAG: ORF6N domain-containing protein [Bacteroidota bacterium]